MKKLGLILLVSLVILGGVFVLNPAGEGDLGQIDALEGEPGTGVQEASVRLSAQEGTAEAEEAALVSGSAGLTDTSRSSMEMGTCGEIRGRVLDPLSEPVADARIFVYHEEEVREQGAKAPVLARAVSDAYGNFELLGLELSKFNLRVQAEGWVDHQSQVLLSTAQPTRAGLIVKMQEGQGVSGVVVDSKGQPLEGAWVVASWPRGWEIQKLWPEVRSDGQGRFAFGNVPASKLHVLAWAEGRGLGMTEGNAGEKQEYRIVVPEAGPYKIKFSLVKPENAEAPKPADVKALLYYVANNAILAMPSPVRSILIPAEGEVDTKGLCEGSFQIHVDSKTVRMKAQWQQKALSKKKPEISIQLAWSVQVGLAGQLLYEDGKPAAGIDLRVAGGLGRDVLTVQSDEKGCFAFPERFGAGQQSWVSIAGPGFAFLDGEKERSYSRVDAGKKDTVLTVRRKTLLAGHVLDAKGKPVPGARVWLHPADRTMDDYGSTTSDNEGRFRVSANRKSKAPLVLDAKDYASFCPSPLTVDTDKKSLQGDLVVRLERGAWVEGIVVDDQGKGIPGANVSATFIPPGKATKAAKPNPVIFNGLQGWGMPTVITISATSDRVGRFRILGLSPGSWRVGANSSGRIKRGVDPTVVVQAGKGRDGLRLVLGSGLSIEGRLFTDAGEPLEGAWINARFDGKLSKTDQGGRSYVQTSKDGSFVLKGLRAGNFKLTAQLPWRMQNELGLSKRGPDGQAPMRPQTHYTTQVMAGTKDFRWEIALPRFGELRARIAQSGAPLSRIQLQFKSGKRSWSFDLPVTQGVVSMKRVLVGSYDVTFRNPRFADHKVHVDVLADQVMDLGLLSLGDLPALECRVVDEAGNGLGGVWIGLDRKLSGLWPEYDLGKGQEQFQGHVLTVSDGSGGFRVPIQGRVLVYAFKPGFAPGVLRYSLPKDGKGVKPGAAPTQEKGKKSAEPRSKEPVLVLERAAEISLVAPMAAKDAKSNWYARLTLLVDPPLPGKKPNRGWSNSMKLMPGKPRRFVGIRPGRYKLEARDFRKGGRYTKKSEPGTSYYEEFLVQVGSQRIIRIP